MFKLVTLLIAVCLCYGHAFADQCATGKDGKKVCAPPGGSAMVNDLGVVVFGAGDRAKNKLGNVKVVKGRCVRDVLGMVMCSNIPNGQATLNKMGLAVCDGGCVVGRYMPECGYNQQHDDTFESDH